MKICEQQSSSDVLALEQYDGPRGQCLMALLACLLELRQRSRCTPAAQQRVRSALKVLAEGKQLVPNKCSKTSLTHSNCCFRYVVLFRCGIRNARESSTTDDRPINNSPCHLMLNPRKTRYFVTASSFCKKSKNKTVAKNNNEMRNNQ
jgi:hypothetical protein